MNKGLYKVLSNINLTKTVYKMILEGDTSSITSPGQFINIKLDGFYLRRPISISDYDGSTITIIYKVVGSGTDYMKSLKQGDLLDIIVGLGNGFNTNIDSNKVLVIGGGVGTPPLYNLTKKLKDEKKDVKVILGFNTKDEVFYEDEFKSLNVECSITTIDGSYGIKGFTTDLIDNDYDYIYTCGPLPMLKAIYNKSKTSGQYSLEERMGCGFGACMGCSIMTKLGSKRVCKDGPIFYKEDLLWD